MGRQKIEIKKIENEDALQVCFSKRRAGLFKKASELSTLCGAEVAIAVFSPAGRPYSIGLPDMDTVVNRFLLCNPARPTGDNTVIRPTRQRNVITRELNKQVMELRSLLDQQRGRRMPMEMMARNSARSIGVDSDSNFEGLSLDRLVRLEEEMLQLRFRVAMRVDELMHGVDQPPPLPPPAPLALLPEAGIPMNYMNQVGFVDPPTRFHEPDAGSLGASGSMGGGGGGGPMDAAFGYSDPFPDMLIGGDAAAHGGLRDGFPDGFL